MSAHALGFSGEGELVSGGLEHIGKSKFDDFIWSRGSKKARRSTHEWVKIVSVSSTSYFNNLHFPHYDLRAFHQSSTLFFHFCRALRQSVIPRPAFIALVGPVSGRPVAPALAEELATDRQVV